MRVINKKIDISNCSDQLGIAVLIAGVLEFDDQFVGCSRNMNAWDEFVRDLDWLDDVGQVTITLDGWDAFCKKAIVHEIFYFKYRMYWIAHFWRHAKRFNLEDDDPSTALSETIRITFIYAERGEVKEIF